MKTLYGKRAHKSLTNMKLIELFYRHFIMFYLSSTCPMESTAANPFRKLLAAFKCFYPLKMA